MSDLRIHAALAPRVAVLASADVDRVVQLNGLADLAALLRPFEASATRVSVRTSVLETRVCDQFPLRFDPYALYSTAGGGRSHEDLLDRVNQLIAVNIKAWAAQVPPIDASDDASPEPDAAQTPWFAAVQDLVLRQWSVSRHDTFGHPVCVLLAVSSASPDPMNDFARLYETASHPSPFPARPYLNPDTLKYYVLIHDVRTSGADLSASMDILEQVKKTYGLHCCLLPINSAPEDREAADPELAALWAPVLPASPASPRLASFDDAATANIAKCLDAEDVKRIKGFIRELTAQSVIPFMERYVQHMGEHLANSRKGLTNRLFGASRKLFGVGTALSSGAKPGANAVSASGGYNAQHDFYAYTTIEAQTRRLADFAFTIRDYKLAASMYDLGRKDYAGDKAGRHAAGATEMFGLSHLLIMYTARSAPIDVDSYLAQACHEYSLRGAGVLPGGASENRALRATLLYYEAYRALNYLRPAPAGLLRTAQSSDEVLSPLLLEQAAIACLRQKPKPALRKHALYLVMAAHRYQACGQKLLSLRCYAQAARVYRQKGWTLVENHIEHELGTQAYNEGDSSQAVQHLLKLVRPSANASAEHEAFVKALQTAHKYSGAESAAELRLPHALFDAQLSALRLVPDASTSASALVDDGTWRSLEEQLVERGLQDRVLEDGATRRRKRPSSVATQAREAAVHSTLWLDLVVHNPLGIELAVDQVCPRFAVDSNEPQMLGAQDVEVGEQDRVVLAPWEHRLLHIAVKIHAEVAVRVWGVAFRLADSIPCVDVLSKKGKRLNGTQEQKRGVVHAPDTTLAVAIHKPRPTLTARITDAPTTLLAGETRLLTVVLKNEGTSAVDDIRALCDQPHLASFQQAAAHTETVNHLHASGPEAVLPNASLAPGQEAEVQLTLRAAHPGPLTVAWLLSFSSPDGETYLTRLALSARVVPGLSVVVQCAPCAGADCEYELTVEATNMSSRATVHVDALSFLSPSWTVEQPPPLGAVAILPLQNWRQKLRISRLAVNQEEWYSHTVTKLQDLLLSKDVKRPPAPPIALTHSAVTFASAAVAQDDGPLYKEQRRKWRLGALADEFPTMTGRDRLETFTLYEASDLDLALHFRTDAARGQVCVYGLHPGPLRNRLRAITNPSSATGSGIRSMYAQTAKELASLLTNVLHCRLATDENPVTVHAARTSADEVEFTLRNLSDCYRAQVEIQLTGPLWLGRTTLRASLQPGSAQVIPALCSHSGPDVHYTTAVECAGVEGRFVEQL